MRRAKTIPTGDTSELVSGAISGTAPAERAVAGVYPAAVAEEVQRIDGRVTALASDSVNS